MFVQLKYIFANQEIAVCHKGSKIPFGFCVKQVRELNHLADIRHQHQHGCCPGTKEALKNVKFPINLASFTATVM